MKRFDDVKTGECFVHDGRPHIKVGHEHAYDAALRQLLNAEVELPDGLDTAVEPLAEVVVGRPDFVSGGVTYYGAHTAEDAMTKMKRKQAELEGTLRADLGDAAVDALLKGVTKGQ